MLLAAALLLSMSNPATALAAKHPTAVVEAVARDRGGVLPVADGGGEPSFFDHYLPFGLADNVHPAVEEGFLVSQILGILLFGAAGSLWGPLVIVKGADLSGDTVVNWLISAALFVGVAMVGFVGVVAVTFLTFGFGALCGFCYLPWWVAAGYVTTNVTLNGISRNTFGKGGAPGPALPQNPKIGGKPSAGNGGASPSYAY
jgi:hypothetical protein